MNESIKIDMNDDFKKYMQPLESLGGECPNFDGPHFAAIQKTIEAKILKSFGIPPSMFDGTHPIKYNGNFSSSFLPSLSETYHLQQWQYLSASIIAGRLPPDIGPDSCARMRLAYRLLDAEEEFEAALFLTDAARLADHCACRRAGRRYMVIAARYVNGNLSDAHLEFHVTGPLTYELAQDIVDRIAGRAFLWGAEERAWMVEVPAKIEIREVSLRSIPANEDAIIRSCDE